MSIACIAAASTAMAAYRNARPKLATVHTAARGATSCLVVSKPRVQRQAISARRASMRAIARANVIPSQESAKEVVRTAILVPVASTSRQFGPVLCRIG